MDLGEQIINLFKNDFASGVLVVVLVLLGVLAALALAAWRKSELYRTNKDKFDLLEKQAVNFIFLAAFGDVDLTEWQEKSDARVEAGLAAVDPRMLYVVDKLELFVNTKLHLHLEFDDLLAIAERKYQELKFDDSSPIPS